MLVQTQLDIEFRLESALLSFWTVTVLCFNNTCTLDNKTGWGSASHQLRAFCHSQSILAVTDRCQNLHSGTWTRAGSKCLAASRLSTADTSSCRLVQLEPLKQILLALFHLQTFEPTEISCVISCKHKHCLPQPAWQLVTWSTIHSQCHIHRLLLKIW
jgi:hypothetical protein